MPVVNPDDLATQHVCVPVGTLRDPERERPGDGWPAPVRAVLGGGWRTPAVGGRCRRRALRDRSQRTMGSDAGAGFLLGGVLLRNRGLRADGRGGGGGPRGLATWPGGRPELPSRAAVGRGVRTLEIHEPRPRARGVVGSPAGYGASRRGSSSARLATVTDRDRVDAGHPRRMGVPLPGFDSIEDVIKHVRATRPQGYETRAATVFRYLDGAWQERTRGRRSRACSRSATKRCNRSDCR